VSHSRAIGPSDNGERWLIGRTKGGLNSKLHAVTDAPGRPIQIFPSGGQTSDYIGARVMFSGFPNAETLLAGRGYDADWFRNALKDRRIAPCTPSHRGRKVPIPHDPKRCV
jgi:transposase